MAQQKSKSEILWIVARVLLGAVFLAAAAPKIIENAEFATTISNYRLLPLAYADKAVPVLAAWLPWFEGVLGLALICGVLAEAAAGWTAILMVAFMAAGGLALARGLDVSCGCFGSGPGSGTVKDALPRDLALLALSVYVAFFSPARKKWAEMNRAAAEAKARQASAARPAPAAGGGRPASAGANVSATKAAMEAALRESRAQAGAKAPEAAPAEAIAMPGSTPAQQVKAPEAAPAEAIPLGGSTAAQAPQSPGQAAQSAECVCPPKDQAPAADSKAASEPVAKSDKASST